MAPSVWYYLRGKTSRDSVNPQKMSNSYFRKFLTEAATYNLLSNQESITNTVETLHVQTFLPQTFLLIPRSQNFIESEPVN